MNLYSTSDPGLIVSFAQAVEQGLAPDGGLFMPTAVPRLSEDVLSTLASRSFQENSFLVLRALLDGEIPERDLREIVELTLTFPAPTKMLDELTGVLELFHGPTLAFKDFGARFMSRTLAYLRRDEPRESTVLVATSGDTGSAVAHGFFGVPGINVVLLYPSGRVSRIQELQLTTVGGNVRALEVAGTFDDCQRLVKTAFADRELVARRRLTSANSINIARLLPQTLYYFEAVARLADRAGSLVFSVPSGNLGNLTAGLIAWKMGLPAHRFIAATNANAVLGHYLASGQFLPVAAIATLSNAMDVGNPSNLARVQALFHGSLEEVREVLVSPSYTDAETRETIASTFARYGYLLDPHGAVGFRALVDYRKSMDGNCTGIVLETAHPSKFPEAFDENLRSHVDTPDRLARLLQGTKESVPMSTAYDDFRNYLLIA